MNTEIIINSVLAFIFGVLVKLYDDLNDNNLFTGTIYEKHKEYINEFLKGCSYILVTYLSSISIYIIFPCSIVLTGFMILDPSAFSNPYEWSGTLSVILFSIFLYIYNFSMVNYNFSMVNYNLIILTILLIPLIYVFDQVIPVPQEYSYQKLLIRGWLVIGSIVFLILNYYFNFFPYNQLLVLWVGVGYMLTSCIFQYLLIHKYLPIQHNNNTTTTTVELSPPEK